MQVNYFHPLTFGMNVQGFAEKGYRVKGHFFKKIQLLIFIFYKNKNKEDHCKHSQVDNLNLHRKCSFIDQYV